MWSVRTKFLTLAPFYYAHKDSYKGKALWMWSLYSCFFYSALFYIAQKDPHRRKTL